MRRSPNDPHRSPNIRAEIEYRKCLTQQHLGIRHSFDDHKDSLDEVLSSWIEPQVRWFDRLFTGFLKERKIRRFLEVGAEKAHIGMHILSHYGIKGTCTDLSFETFQMATPVVQALLGAKERPPMACADVHALPFQDDSFDLVFCFSALHHFYDVHAALREIKRVLEEGGIFFCTWEPMSPLLGKEVQTSSEVEWGVFENQYTYLEYRRLLQQHFKNVRAFLPREPLAPSSTRHRGVKALIRRVLPSGLLWIRQVVLTGSGFYTAICEDD